MNKIYTQKYVKLVKYVHEKPDKTLEFTQEGAIDATFHKMFSFISSPKAMQLLQGRESFIPFEVFHVVQCIADSITRIE